MKITRPEDSSTGDTVSVSSGIWISAWRTITHSLSILWGYEGQPGTQGDRIRRKIKKNNWKVRFDNGHSSEKQALNWYESRLVSFQGKMWKHSLSFPSRRGCCCLAGSESFRLRPLSYDTRLPGFLLDPSSTLMSHWKIIRACWREIF